MAVTKTEKMSILALAYTNSTKKKNIEKREGNAHNIIHAMFNKAEMIRGL